MLMRVVMIAAVSVTIVAANGQAIGQPINLNGAVAETCFVPGEDCAAKVADLLAGAKSRVWLLGYGFTSTVIHSALAKAKARGVDVRVVLDRSNATSKYSGATFASNAGIPVRIDRTVRIAHNKLIIIDADIVVTGSFNWTAAANKSNAENIHVIRGSKALAERNSVYFLNRERVSEPYSGLPPR